VRPDNWELQTSAQREIVPRVSAYAGYTRRWYGNLFATQNLNVSNASYTQYCVAVPTDSRLPDSGQSLCGLFDINHVTAPNNLVFNSKRVGGVKDIYDGFDFDASARLRTNVILSGGVSFGRERIDTCNLVNDLSLSYSTGVFPPRNDPHTSAYCDVRPPFQPLVKGQLSYPLPWSVSVAATFQTLPGPELRAQYPLTNALVSGSLGRNFTSVPPTIDLVPSGTLYGDRIYQTDLRFSRTFHARNTTVRPVVSIYNLFNANPVQTYNLTYGPAWLAPTVIMQARFADIGVQVEF
jgi:hypothetical protein